MREIINSSHFLKDLFFPETGAGPKKKVGKDFRRAFPGGPLTKNLCSQCRGRGFNPWSGNQIPHTATKSSNVAAKAPA